MMLGYLREFVEFSLQLQELRLKAKAWGDVNDAEWDAACKAAWDVATRSKRENREVLVEELQKFVMALLMSPPTIRGQGN